MCVDLERTDIKTLHTELEIACRCFPMTVIAGDPLTGHGSNVLKFGIR